MTSEFTPEVIYNGPLLQRHFPLHDWTIQSQKTFQLNLQLGGYRFVEDWRWALKMNAKHIVKPNQHKAHYGEKSYEIKTFIKRLFSIQK